jgi:hypothetical protein
LEAGDSSCKQEFPNWEEGLFCGDANPMELKPVFFAILLSMTGPISAPVAESHVNSGSVL